MRDATDPGFRLFMTALPHPKFPLALQQMSVKVCNEPPAGLRASLMRTFTTIVSQVCAGGGMGGEGSEGE